MKISELLEAAWVIKNKDGKEKRFKDSNSPEAKAWAASSAKLKTPMYSKEWWDKKVASSYDVIAPWESIHDGDIPSATIKAAVKDLYGSSAYDIMGTKRLADTTVDGVRCARIALNVMVLHTAADDLGIENDAEEIYKITFTRRIDDPKKFNYF